VAAPSLIRVPFDAWRIFIVSHANALHTQTAYSLEQFVYLNLICNAGPYAKRRSRFTCSGSFTGAKPRIDEIIAG
jgi:hypothetical protein